MPVAAERVAALQPLARSSGETQPVAEWHAKEISGRQGHAAAAVSAPTAPAVARVAIVCKKIRALCAAAALVRGAAVPRDASAAAGDVTHIPRRKVREPQLNFAAHYAEVL